MPNDGDPRHPVWSVCRPILAHQVLEICNLSHIRMIIGNVDVDVLVTVLIRNLANGWDQKTVCKQLTPPACEPQHHAIFKAFSSWLFATQGVLSNIYHSVLAECAIEAGHAPLQQSGVPTGLDGQTWGPPISQHSLLLRLPNELFDQVLKYLPGQDVNDVRLTCRQSRSKSFNFWARTFFTKRQFMIDDYSLQTLLNISRHPELRSVLTYLIIGTDQINTKDTLSFLHRMHATNPNRISTMFRYWRDAAAAQQALLNTGRATELLSQAIANLTELKAISISGSMNSRCPPYLPNTIEYPNQGLRSYGASAYQMQRRDVSDQVPNSRGFLDKVFNCILNALMRSSPRNLRTLKTNLGRGSSLPHLNDEAFYLPPFALFTTGNLTFLAYLTRLHLDVNFESRSVRRIRRLAEHQHTFDPCNDGLRNILCACYGLVSLTLNVFCAPHYVNHCDFTACLVDPVGGQSDTPVDWPFLQSLVLKGLYMSPTTLRNIFVKFDTVKNVILKDIFLLECFIDHPIIAHNSQAELENHLASFLRGSADVLRNLETLELDGFEVLRFREDPDDVVAVIKDTDTDAIAFVAEEPRAGAAGDRPSRAVTVTDFRVEALEALARRAWLCRDWERVKAAAEAGAEVEAVVEEVEGEGDGEGDGEDSD
ncbi:hypothetical protein DHEL01_v210319 [Diaporthe helianthi]|uniref:F-box domain-containing protein n=1 Tax=Diaporthe helianthi TaxID=158607 RepID=A0A2P5HLY7_DIAHE|nr:hypothetical protein DHEL01_v210319 [Diaporthe helianthi]